MSSWPLNRGFVSINCGRWSGLRGCRWTEVNLVEKPLVHENLTVGARLPLLRGLLLRGFTVLYIETGLLDPEFITKKNRISMESRIIQGDNHTMKQIMELKHKDSWAEQNRKIKEKLKITETDVTSTKYHLKNTLQNKAKESMKEKINTTAEKK